MKMYKVLLSATLLTFALPLGAQAQTVSAKGVKTGADAISAAVPKARNLELMVKTITEIKTQVKGCAANGLFYSESKGCFSWQEPINIEFSQNATSTIMKIQWPDGSYETRDIDGKDGEINVVPFGS